MDIPQVSISVDTSDSGALSVETCKEVILEPSDSAEHTRDDSSKDACDHVKNAVESLKHFSMPELTRPGLKKKNANVTLT